MSEKTKIAWCDSTVNFLSGCAKVSAGCANFTLAHRLNRKPWICDACGKPSAEPQPDKALPPCECGVDVGYHRRRIFSLSLGDWLDPEIPVEWLAEMMDTIRQCDQVNWILCTKRPELWEDRMTLAIGSDLRREAHGKEFNDWLSAWTRGHAPKNVCALASVENQAMADLRIPALLRIPARWRGLSCEPLLGPVDLELRHGCRGCNHPGNIVVHWNQHGRCSLCDGTGHEPSGIHWVIIGGESGPNARPCNVEWIRSLAAQGKAAGVATFVKQLGAYPIGSMIQANGGLLDRKGGDPSEWPHDLRIQEWPEGL